MDIELSINLIVPEALYSGLPLDPDSYASLDWQDARPKPPWSALELAYGAWLISNAAHVIRKDRDRLLTACDWTQMPDSPLAAEQRAAWTTYRQGLRDVPAQAGFPAAVEWPVPPA